MEPKAQNGISQTVVFLLIFTPLLIATGQVLFKIVSGRIDAESGIMSGLIHVLFDPFFIASLVIYGGGTLVWIFVLREVPLAVAYSFMALTFIFVPVLARIFLLESLPPKYFVGTALIMLGLVVQRLG